VFAVLKTDHVDLALNGRRERVVDDDLAPDDVAQVAADEALSNVRSDRFGSDYSPTRERAMGDRGFEPRTSALSERRSNQLS
jgi:hypothetical protein